MPARNTRLQCNLISYFQRRDLRADFCNDASRFVSQNHGIFDNKRANGPSDPVVYLLESQCLILPFATYIRHGALTSLPQIPVTLISTRTSVSDFNWGSGRSSYLTTPLDSRMKEGFYMPSLSGDSVIVMEEQFTTCVSVLVAMMKEKRVQL